MSPNCMKCDQGRHFECTADPGYCQCGTTNHPKVDHRDHMVQDLWMALGGRTDEFDLELKERGTDDLWAFLLGEVRVSLKRATAFPAKALPDPPLMARAKALLDDFVTVEEIDASLSDEVAVTTVEGRTLHGVTQAILTVRGRVT